jgi:ubiquinone/menaquinone biosynthesis C-methylase UbiE
MAQPLYVRFDSFYDAASIELEKARELSDRLERRGRADAEIAARNAYLDLIAVRPGERVLDIGCGSGVVTRELARRVAPDGLAIGVDPSPAMLSMARELADQDGVGQWIDLRVGDARALPFADAEFDVVIAATVLSHFPGGQHVIPELVRVLRPGGRLGIFDRDTDSFIVAHPDRALTRRIVAAFSDHGSVDGWLARRLPGLFAEAGLRDVGVRAFTPLETDAEGFYAGTALLRALDIAIQAEAISEQERQRWVDALHAEQAAGRFMAGLTHLFVWGSKPS